MIPDPFDISTAGWADGLYYVRINAVDEAGNRYSLLLEFTLDSTRPSIILNNPPNNSLIQSGTTLDFTVNDTHLLHVNYSANGGTRVSIIEPFDITADWLDGTYNIQVNAIDTAGNTNSASFAFTLDSTPPVTNIDPSLNHSIVPVGTVIPINISGEDLEGWLIKINAFENEIKIETIPSWENVAGYAGMHSEEFKEDPYEVQEALNQLVELGYIEEPGDNIQKAVMTSVVEGGSND